MLIEQNKLLVGKMSENYFIWCIYLFSTNAVRHEFSYMCACVSFRHEFISSESDHIPINSITHSLLYYYLPALLKLLSKPGA